MTKMELRLKLINHVNPKDIVIDNFSDVYEWNTYYSQYHNLVVFLEIVRIQNLWDKLKEILE